MCAAPIGVGADGKVSLDLSRPGEHVLIAGRRGAGTSELVRSIVLSFALGHRPDEVAFVLVDGLESTTFRHLDRLPHVAGSITEFDASAARRLVRSLDAELRRRAEAPEQTFPELLVVIHELAAALDVPGFGAELNALAERGGELGLHVVASTRRPLTVAAASPPIAFTTRIALRLDDPADAVSATGSPDAAALPGIVGRGVLVTDDGTPHEVQAATVIAERPTTRSGTSSARIASTSSPSCWGAT